MLNRMITPEGVFPTRTITPYEWQYQAILKETMSAEESHGIIQALPYAMLNIDLTSDLPLLKTIRVDVEDAKRMAIRELHSSDLKLESYVDWYKANGSEENDDVAASWVRTTTVNDRLGWMIFKSELSCSISMHTSELINVVPLYIAAYAFLTIMLANELNLTASHLSITLLSPYVFSENRIDAKLMLERMGKLENISYVTGSLESELSKNETFAPYFKAINSYPTFFLKWGLDDPQSIFSIDEECLQVSNYEWVEEGV